MNPYSIPPLMAVIVALLLGLLIYFKNRKSERNLAFALLCFSTVVWQLTWTLLFNIYDNEIAAILVKVGYSGIIFLPITIFHFAVKYTEKKIDRIMSYIAYAIGGLLLIVLWGTDYYIRGYYQYFFGYYPMASYLHPFYLVFLFTLVYRCYVIFNSKIGEKESPLLQKDQAKYLKMSVVFYSVAATDFLANYGIEFYPMGFVFVVLSLGIIAYTITKHRLMDISVIISRALAEFLTTSFYAIIYLTLVWLHHIFISPSVDIIFLTASILYGILVAQTYQFSRLKVQTTSDKLILRGKYDYYKALADIGTQITKVLSMENIQNTLRQTFYEIIEVANPRVYLPGDFTRPEVRNLLDVKELTFKEKDLVIPCLIEDRLIALIVLGKKLSEDPYTDEDIKLLQALASQVAIAIDHTHTYEKIKKDFEANQKKLYDTERLLARSEKIAAMANLIQEYNHQIKTPLAVIKGRVGMLFDRNRDEQYLKEIQKIIIEQIDRADYIVESTLRLTRPRERKEIELDLNDVIENALRLFPPSGVQLIKKLSPIPQINGDKEDLETVFINLIKNAAEAMPKGGELTMSTHLTTDGDNSVVCAEITDTGVGIPEANMEKIFEPFFSTYVTKGRGIGLSVVFKIIREHLGKIEVKSQIGKGTTFTVKLPVKV
jgi:signal transduction histidine kinase